MKVLSIAAPYAQLIFARHPVTRLPSKYIETRTWHPNAQLGRVIAIHCSKTPLRYKEAPIAWDLLGEVLEAPGDDLAGDVTRQQWRLPKDQSIVTTGAIIGTVKITKCVPIISAEQRHASVAPFIVRNDHGVNSPALHTGANTDSLEPTKIYLFDQVGLGHWETATHAWFLNEAVLFNEPVPFTGGQMFTKSWEPT
jgi:hypothetical protein